jgi:hypothetical protein
LQVVAEDDVAAKGMGVVVVVEAPVVVLGESPLPAEDRRRRLERPVPVANFFMYAAL